MDDNQDCNLIPKIKVTLANGKTARLDLNDCMGVVNTLLHHKLLQFDIDLDRQAMKRPIEQWESLAVWGESGCFRYDDEVSCLTVNIKVNDSNMIGGLPREEFRTKPNLPKASDN
jgi:hypothetical protein